MKIYIILLVLFTLIFSGVINVRASNAEDGKNIFDEKCKGCHVGKSNVPSISILSGLSEKDIVNKVRNGVQGTMMRSFSTDELNDSGLNNIVAYLKSSSVTNTTNKTSGFDINFGIMSILFIYIIYNKKLI